MAFATTYRLDFAWSRELVALECDGRKWHEIERDDERDRTRWSAITAATAYRIIWATWWGVREEPERLVAQVRESLRRRVSRRGGERHRGVCADRRGHGR